jgi:hypothetical protein
MWRLLTREFNFRAEVRMQFNKVGVPHRKPIGWMVRFHMDGQPFGSTRGATAVPYRIYRHEMLDANDTALRLP